MSLVLAGDIGGTNSRVSLVEWQGGSAITLWSRTWRSRDHAGVEEILALALDGSALVPEAACLGVAGPVQDGRCRTTNLPWSVDARNIADALGLDPARVALINDVEAAALGLADLGTGDVATLQQGRPQGEAEPLGARLLVSIGTGFGAAFIVEVGDIVDVLPSEAGHATFAPEDDLERELAAFVTQRRGRASVESIVSGPGLGLAHEFLARRGGGVGASGGAGLPLPLDGAGVSAAAQRGEAPAREALELFARMLGSALGNLALAPLPRGGIILAGGMPRRLLPWLTSGASLARFIGKSPMERLLERLPLRVALREDLGLLGAARRAMTLAETPPPRGAS